MHAALECNSPPNIINGTVSTNGHNHIVSSKATYSCNSGYSLIGADTLTCIQKGSGAFWDQEVPTCSKCKKINKPYERFIIYYVLSLQ